MRYSVFFVLLSGAAVLFSCSEKESPERYKAYGGGELLPLETGNYWKLGILPALIVTGTRVVNGKTYYGMEGIGGITYLRVTDGKVYGFVPRTNDHVFEEAVMFDGNAKVNETWKFFEWEVTLQSNTDSVTIGDTVIRHCRRYFFNIPLMADEEYMIWLAPGIGYVQYRCMGECIGTFQKLEDAKIGGATPGFLTRD